MSKVTSSLVHTFMGRYAFILINLASMMTYARLLTPEEIGIHVIAITASAIIIELRLIGTGSYIIKLSSVTTKDIENVLFVTLGISLILGLSLYYSAEWLSNFYEVSGMVSVIEILVGTFLLTPFTAVSQSYLSRQFNFKVLATINVLSALCSFIVTILLIELGLSYLSLAFGVLAAQFFQFLAHFIVKPEIVSWVPRPGNFKNILSFGGTLTIVTFINKATESLPELALGKVIGPSASALFSRGLGAVRFSNETVLGFVLPLVTPYFSEAKRTGGLTFDAYEKATSHVTILIVPILMSLAVVPDLAITLLFGDQWLEASSILSILCITFALTSTTHFFKNLLIVEEKESFILYVKLISFPIFIIFALTFGTINLLSMSFAFATATVMEALGFYFILCRYMSFDLRRHLINQSKSFLLGTICLIVTYFSSSFFKLYHLPVIVETLILALVLSTLWIVSIVLMKHEISKTIFTLLERFPYFAKKDFFIKLRQYGIEAKPHE